MPELLDRPGPGQRLRVGVVGCGLVAQVMHLPLLAELSDRFEIAAICDLSPTVLAACASRYGVPATTTRWEELIDLDLDAVLVATPGSHAPVAVAAARRGLHVFVEKPMCVALEEGVEMIEAARAADVRLMVGTMKRYDRAYARLADELAGFDDLRVVRVTTLESPFQPYVAGLPLVAARDVDPALLAELAAEDGRLVDLALGPGGDAGVRTGYRQTLLDCLVHELNLLRGLLGEPDELVFAEVTPERAIIVLRFGTVDCHLTWVDLPGIARYVQELSFLAPARRATLSFSSPFLRGTPNELVLEGGEAGTARAWRTSERTSFEDAFELELIEFHECVSTGREPRTDGADGLRDVALCAAIARATATGGRIERPTTAADLALSTKGSLR